MNNATLFHRWAHQVKPQGKSGNVFYEGPILYSYGHHFPAAVLTGKKTDGKEIVLVNSRRHSPTTSKHLSFARRASSHMSHIYVPSPDSPIQPSNLSHLNSETAHAIERLKHVRTEIDYREANARRCEQTAKIYRRVFLKGRGHVHALPKDFAEILAAARAREERHNNPPPELLAKRDKDRVKRDEKRETERQARRDKELKAAETAVARWRDGENVHLAWSLPCMLRLKAPDTVQTSLGAEIPLSHAERVYRLVLGIMAKGEDWETNGHTIPVGVYKVDKITKDGELRAGCHRISFEEIDRFAAERGWRK